MKNLRDNNIYIHSIEDFKKQIQNVEFFTHFFRIDLNNINLLHVRKQF
jgi:hypothetical protein